MPRLSGWLVAILLVAAGGAAAQELRVAAGFDRRTVAPGDRVTYSITISGDELPGGRVLPAPDFREFESAIGPSSGQSSEIRFVNGAMTKRENLTMSWQLVTKSAGHASVPPCTFSVGSRLVTTQRADLTVDPRAQSADRVPPGYPRGLGGRREQGRPWTEPVRRVGEGLSVRTEVSERTVFVGQAIVVRDILTFDTNVSSFKERAPPEFSGFAKKRNSDIRPEGRRVQDPKTGQARSEAVIGQWVIVPLTAGRKDLPGHSYSFFVPSSDPMQRMIGGEDEVPRDSAPIVIDVQPLPDGPPAGFDAAVGSFQLTASLASTTLQSGDGTQLIVTVRGKGSFESITPPKIVIPSGLKSFDPEIVDSVSFSADGQLEGRKTFTYPLLALNPGRHELPGIDWAFFDPQAQRYVERRTEPLALEAIGGAADVAVSAPVAPVLPVEVDNSDIRHLKGSLPAWRPDLSTRGVPFWLVAVAVAGPLVNVLLVAGSLVGRLLQRDPVVRRAQDAPRLARQRLSKARVALAAGRKVDAADAAAKAIAGLVSDRLGLGAELAPAEAAAALASVGAAELGGRVERFLTGCDFVRFASGSAADAQRLLHEAENLLAPLARQEAGRSA